MKHLLSMSLICVIVLAACESGGGGGEAGASLITGGGSSTTGSTTTTGSSTTGVPDTVEDNVLAVNVYTTPELGSAAGVTKLQPFINVTNCVIPGSVDPYTGSLAARNIGCEVKVEEAVLYYSKVKIEYGTGLPDVCTFTSFAPYFYRASNSAAFFPFWRSGDVGVDCTGASDDGKDLADCYNGPAKDILTGFPDLPSGPTQDGENGVDGFYSFTIASGHSKGVGSNRWIANAPRATTGFLGRAGTGPGTGDENSDGIEDNLSVARTDFDNGNGAKDGYVTTIVPAGATIGSTYQDYKFTCYDDFQEQLYSISLFISDYDTVINPDGSEGIPHDDANNPILNDFGDWDSADNSIDPQP